MTVFFSSISIWFWQQTTHGNIWATWLHRQRSRFPPSLLFHNHQEVTSSAILLFIYSLRQSCLQYLVLNFKTLWINGMSEKSQLVNDDETLPSSGGRSQHNVISSLSLFQFDQEPSREGGPEAADGKWAHSAVWSAHFHITHICFLRCIPSSNGLRQSRWILPPGCAVPLASISLGHPPMGQQCEIMNLWAISHRWKCITQ